MNHMWNSCTPSNHVQNPGTWQTGHENLDKPNLGAQRKVIQQHQPTAANRFIVHTIE